MSSRSFQANSASLQGLLGGPKRGGAGSLGQSSTNAQSTRELASALAVPMPDGVDLSDCGVRETKYCGLLNQGSTCYMNSVLQCLFHLGHFREQLYQSDLSVRSTGGEDRQDVDHKAAEAAEKTNFVRALQQLFACMEFCTKPTESTLPLTGCFGWKGQQYQQHDCLEFVQLLVDGIKTKHPQSRVTECLNSLLTGRQVHYTQCLSCRTVSKSFQPFINISAAVEGCSSLEEGLSENFGKVEVMTGSAQYRCATCNDKQDAHRACCLMPGPYLPPVLFVQLSRYVYDKKTWQRKKLNHSMDIPLVMTLRDEWVFDQSKLEDASSGDDGEEGKTDGDKDAPEVSREYALYAVINHTGNTHGGHYTAYVKDLSASGLYSYGNATAGDQESTERGDGEGDKSQEKKQPTLQRDDADLLRHWYFFNDDLVYPLSPRQTAHLFHQELPSDDESSTGADESKGSGQSQRVYLPGGAGDPFKSGYVLVYVRKGQLWGNLSIAQPTQATQDAGSGAVNDGTDCKSNAAPDLPAATVSDEQGEGAEEKAVELAGSQERLAMLPDDVRTLLYDRQSEYLVRQSMYQRMCSWAYLDLYINLEDVRGTFRRGVQPGGGPEHRSKLIDALHPPNPEAWCVEEVLGGGEQLDSPSWVRVRVKALKSKMTWQDVHHGVVDLLLRGKPEKRSEEKKSSSDQQQPCAGTQWNVNPSARQRLSENLARLCELGGDGAVRFGFSLLPADIDKLKVLHLAMVDLSTTPLPPYHATLTSDGQPREITLSQIPSWRSQSLSDKPQKDVEEHVCPAHVRACQTAWPVVPPEARTYSFKNLERSCVLLVPDGPTPQPLSASENSQQSPDDEVQSSPEDLDSPTDPLVLRSHTDVVVLGEQTGQTRETQFTVGPMVRHNSQGGHWHWQNLWYRAQTSAGAVMQCLPWSPDRPGVSMNGGLVNTKAGSWSCLRLVLWDLSAPVDLLQASGSATESDKQLLQRLDARSEHPGVYPLLPPVWVCVPKDLSVGLLKMVIHRLYSTLFGSNVEDAPAEGAQCVSSGGSVFGDLVVDSGISPVMLGPDMDSLALNSMRVKLVSGDTVYCLPGCAALKIAAYTPDTFKLIDDVSVDGSTDELKSSSPDASGDKPGGSMDFTTTPVTDGSGTTEHDCVSCRNGAAISAQCRNFLVARSAAVTVVFNKPCRDGACGKDGGGDGGTGSHKTVTLGCAECNAPPYLHALKSDVRVTLGTLKSQIAEYCGWQCDEFKMRAGKIEHEWKDLSKPLHAYGFGHEALNPGDVSNSVFVQHGRPLRADQAIVNLKVDGACWSSMRTALGLQWEGEVDSGGFPLLGRFVINGGWGLPRIKAALVAYLRAHRSNPVDRTEFVYLEEAEDTSLSDDSKQPTDGSHLLFWTFSGGKKRNIMVDSPAEYTFRRQMRPFLDFQTLCVEWSAVPQVITSDHVLLKFRWFVPQHYKKPKAVSQGTEKPEDGDKPAGSDKPTDMDSTTGDKDTDKPVDKDKPTEKSIDKPADTDTPSQTEKPSGVSTKSSEQKSPAKRRKIIRAQLLPLEMSLAVNKTWTAKQLCVFISQHVVPGFLAQWKEQDVKKPKGVSSSGIAEEHVCFARAMSFNLKSTSGVAKLKFTAVQKPTAEAGEAKGVTSDTAPKAASMTPSEDAGSTGKPGSDKQTAQEPTPDKSTAEKPKTKATGGFRGKPRLRSRAGGRTARKPAGGAKRLMDAPWRFRTGDTVVFKDGSLVEAKPKPGPGASSGPRSRANRRVEHALKLM